MISGFRREIAENFCLLGYYAASSGNFLLMNRDNLAVPFSGFKNRFFNTEDGTNRFPETSVRNYHYSLHNNPKESYSQVLGRLFVLP